MPRRISSKEHLDQSSSIQGSYTDHSGDPMEIRNQLFPMGKDEREDFHWVLNKVKNDLKERGEDIRSTADLYDEGIDQGLFYYGSHGELRVVKDIPNG